MAFHMDGEYFYRGDFSRAKAEVSLAAHLKGNFANESSRKKAFTLIELLVVVAIISILSLLVANAVSVVSARGKRIVCGSNVRQLSVMLAIFTGEHQRFPMFLGTREDGVRYPGQGSTWLSSIAPDEMRVLTQASGDDRPKSVALCPTIHRSFKTVLNDGNESWVLGLYGYNAYGMTKQSSSEPLGLSYKLQRFAGGFQNVPVSVSDVIAPAGMIAIGDGVMGWDQIFNDASGRLERNIECKGTPESSARVTKRHSGKLNVGFCDGHVELISLERLFGSNEPGAMAMWNRDNQPH